MPRRDLLRALGPGRRRETDRAVAQALGDLRRRAGDAETQLAELRQELGNLRWWLQQTSDRSDETAGRLEGTIADHASDQERLGRLVAADAALDDGGGLELETFDVGLGGLVRGFRDGGADTGEQVYAGFEDYFRGSESEIRERQRAYLPLMEGRRVLDIGCGRGEFLEVLRDAGIEAVGIDLDPAMVQRCRNKGLQVEQNDAVSYLAGLAPGALGAIFAGQVIEHLSYDDLIALLQTSLSRVEPGGVLVMETVNPHAPQALKHFWIDPTHRNPLFPEVVLALCRLSGFAEGYIWYPNGTGDPDRDRGEQLDYAVIARTVRS